MANKNLELQALDYARKVGLPYNDIKYVCAWHGWNVYKGYFKSTGEDVASGPPLYILEKDGEFRITTVDECFEILDHLIKNST